ncbi:MAG: 5-oxoprolinase subunit PxpB [Pseudomonadota bacterium]
MKPLRVVHHTEQSLIVLDLALAEAQQLAQHLQASEVWIDVVQGLNSVAVFFDPCRVLPNEAEERLRTQIEQCAEKKARQPGKIIDLPVTYGGEVGPDLALVAERAGFTESSIIDMHTDRIYNVAMLGFMPGFAYLDGLDERLRQPRLTSPRMRVPAGSVAISDGYTGVYPLQSPGGWLVLGRVQRPLVRRRPNPEFLLTAQARVRFRAV